MNDTLVTTAEAAELLGVKTSTVYTYVSRGRLDSIRKPGDPGSWFHRSDVESLAKTPRKRRRAPAADRSEQSGTHRTAITEISDTTYRYRGRDPFQLAAAYSFEQVAEFLWTGRIPAKTDWPLPHGVPTRPRPSALPLNSLRVAVSERAVDDPLRFGNPASAIKVTGRSLMTDLVSALPTICDPVDESRFAEQLWGRLAPSPPTPEQLSGLESAMSIVADHGIAPSTLAVRISAGYRADLYGAVQAGMSIMAGGWYGRRALSAERMLSDIETSGDAELVIGNLLRQGGVPCLGQPRYIDSDPRTQVILDLIDGATPDAPALRATRDVQRITRERALPAPSVELALAAMCRSFDFVTGASEAIFAIARTAGWIAHAIEIYARPMSQSPIFEYVPDERT